MVGCLLCVYVVVLLVRPQTPPTMCHIPKIYIIMDIMETDLKAILKSGQEITESHVQYFIYQILRGLDCIHKADVIHRCVNLHQAQLLSSWQTTPTNLPDSRPPVLTTFVVPAIVLLHPNLTFSRDLTPSNILLNTNCDLKICDFGLAREEGKQELELTDYVVMRWYRYCLACCSFGPVCHPCPYHVPRMSVTELLLADCGSCGFHP